MEGRMLAAKTYVVICALLILLTCLTVGASFLPLGGWHLVIGLAIALSKATVVVLFFMHALVSPRVTRSVIVVTCFWLLILLGLTMTDYVTRGLIPFMPGH